MTCYSSPQIIQSGSGCYETYTGSCPQGYTRVGYTLYGDYDYDCAGRNEANLCQQNTWPSQNNDSVLLACCNGTNTDYTKCDPEACFGTSKCNGRLVTFCSDQNNVTSSFCQSKVCGTSLLDCYPIMAQYCAVGDNIISNACATLRTNRPDLADPLMQAYCARNPTDTNICGCLNLQQYADFIASATQNSINVQPWCNLQTCVSGAYLPSSMRASGNSSQPAPCSTQNICIQSLSVGSIDQSKLNNVTLSCNQSTNTTPTTGSGDTTTSSNATSFTIFNYIVTPGAAFFFLLVIAIVGLAFSAVYSALRGVATSKQTVMQAAANQMSNASPNIIK
jgi:hypothetical protein